eukprot:gb/GEZN01010836.1/.p1 GENE.gb/GEZN01010836.1/~~gb/GEZN01010836.1/.p1  ORF type:complete len:360 (-),score=57.42 gb/GEZN01010836.1/:127-1179(-)
MSSFDDALPDSDPSFIRGPSVVLGKREAKWADRDAMDTEEVPIVDLALNQLSTYVEGERTATILRSYFKGEEFRTICAQVFAQVDKDLSGSIDAGELLTAYGIIMSRIPSKAAVNKFGLANSSKMVKLGKSFLNRMWKYLDVDKNGSLDENEFVDAMKLLWTEAVKINTKATGPDKILDAVFTLLYTRFPRAQVDQLKIKFHTPMFAKACEKVFKQVDKDGDGRLDRKETYNAFTLVLKSIPEISQVLGYDTLRYSDTTARLLINNTFNHLDTDGSGYLEWNEFPKAMMLLWCDAFVVAKSNQKAPSSSGSSSPGFPGPGQYLGSPLPLDSPSPLSQDGATKRRKIFVEE